RAGVPTGGGGRRACPPSISRTCSSTTGQMRLPARPGSYGCRPTSRRTRTTAGSRRCWPSSAALGLPRRHDLAAHLTTSAVRVRRDPHHAWVQPLAQLTALAVEVLPVCHGGDD